MNEMVTKNYIKTLKKDKNKITITPGDALKPYLIGDFFVQYESEFDISDVEDEIAVIPFVLSTAAIVWCSGDVLSLDRLDANLAESLPLIKAEYEAMYPNIEWNGEIVVKEKRTLATTTGLDGMLFSGGLDSIHSALTIEGKKYLFTINGADSKLNEEYPWKFMKTHALDFAKKNHHKPVFVYSNFKEFLNVPVLHSWHREITHWYSHVQFGPALIGLTAPIMYKGGGNTLYISSGGQTHNLVRGWGSSKKLDEKVRFGNVAVNHYGNRTRMEKIQDIVDIRREKLDHDIVLRVCPKYDRGADANCGICEKCIKTSTLLLLEGENPREWGFPTDSKSTLQLLKKRLRRFAIKTPAVFANDWRIIQSRANEVELDKELKDDIEWLTKFNFSRYYKLRNFLSPRKLYLKSPKAMRKFIRKMYYRLLKK